MRIVAYNLGQGGRRDPAAWLRLLGAPLPQLLFVQESRNPANSWLPWLQLLQAAAGEQTEVDCLWEEAGRHHWGSGLVVRSGRITAVEVPQAYRGRVAAGLVEDLCWPGGGRTAVLAISIHAPTAKGSSYMKEVHHILDFACSAREISGNPPLVLGGDFNVSVALREAGHPLYDRPGDRALLPRLQDEMGLIPCWQAAHPGEEPARTLRWMRKLDSLPYHCDGLFVPAAWRGALQACDVLEDEDWCAQSDHNPVVATLAERTTI